MFAKKQKENKQKYKQTTEEAYKETVNSTNLQALYILFLFLSSETNYM